MSEQPAASLAVVKMADQRFLHAYRITRGAEFQRAFQRRLTAGDDRLLVFAYPNGLAHPRLGLSVSRKVGGAVVGAAEVSGRRVCTSGIGIRTGL